MISQPARRTRDDSQVPSDGEEEVQRRRCPNYPANACKRFERLLRRWKMGFVSGKACTAQ